MDDPSKVEAMAREGNWTPRPLPDFLVGKEAFRTSRLWDVARDENNFTVDVWTSHLGQHDYNNCSMYFLSNNVNREEFLRSIAASLRSGPAMVLGFAQPHRNCAKRLHQVFSDAGFQLRLVPHHAGSAQRRAARECVEQVHCRPRERA